MEPKNIILFINKIPKGTADDIRVYGKEAGTPFRVGVLIDSRLKGAEAIAEREKLATDADIVLMCDLSKHTKIAKALHPYKDQIIAVTCRAEGFIPEFAKVVPHLPYLRTPTSESLLWASDKIAMREMMRVYDKDIVPKFTVVSSAGREAMAKIKEKVGFPLVLKPAGLAASLLVNICFHEEELEKTLRRTLAKVRKIYKENHRSSEPKVLVEQFMEGDMYSIDGYVTSRGKMYFCPMVHVKTGRTVGFDDFFGYEQTTPTLLKKNSIDAAEAVAAKATHALRLRSTTVHVELIKMEDRWKVIELGARVGGFRQKMYKLAFGFDHGVNDVLIRMGQEPKISKKNQGYAMAMKMFAKKEGVLTELKGIKKIQELKSFVDVTVNKKVGDRCAYAKHGGRSVCDIMLFNAERSKLLADVRRIEQLIVIKTSGRTKA